MRIGLAQLNPTVGDLAGNLRRLLSAYHELVAAGAELVVTPELAVCGYPPRDLLLRSRFVQDVENATAELAAATGAVPLLVGTVVGNPQEQGRRAFNAAAFCHHGRVQQIAKKCLLPTYDVFDEDRYFEPAPAPSIIVHAGKRIGVTICEDIWANESPGDTRLHRFDPVAHLKAEGVDLLVNLSASPWYDGKAGLRERIVTDLARDLAAPVVYCNAVGGNDELIFDGRSVVVSAKGEITARLAAFAEEKRVVDLALSSAHVPAPGSPLPAPGSPLQDIHAALVLGLRDYAHKSGFTRALIALSGGIDSALVAELAVAAFGPENVIGVSLPSAISSEHSKDDARILAQNLGIRFETIAIADTVAAAERALGPVFAGRAPDVTEENLQARTRGVLMMALSNKFGALLLTTGNKSEVAVGYCTLYGDMCGGLAVISDLFKTQVYALCRWINEQAGRDVIPRNTIEKPPSAELRPGQVDQDSLPPYDVLDALLLGYIEEGLSRAELVAKGLPEPMVRDICRKVDLNEYKRKQAAPGLKITPLAFGVGRRIPIVQKYVG